MNDRTSSCDFERLKLLLASELSADLEAETVEHVGGCTTCRHKLEALAGDEDWWSEVQTCFRKNAESLQTSFAAGSQMSDDSGHANAQDSFEADFAVDFLEPCEQPNTLGKIDDIEVLEVIGRGGMGVVLKGRQRELGRFVAVKVMAPHLAASGSARERFAREARAAAAIVHPHVMAIHSVNVARGLPYLVMPFIACESLQQRLDREGPLELQEILRIGRQMAAGLSAAHAQGLVHRDVKPANILLEKGVDRVMLTDFGLARAVDDASLTRTGVIAGTPQFMSPEQARGEAIDARSDLFSLGSVLYAISTGRPPFRAETSLAVLRRISDTEPRALGEINARLPDWLATIISRLHAKDPSERFPSAADVGVLLEECLAHVEQPAAAALPDKVRPAATPLRSRRTVLLRFLAVGIIGLAIAAVFLAIASAPHRNASTNGDAAAESDKDESPAPTPAWHDSVEAQLLDLQHGANALESRVEQFWDATTPTGEEPDNRL